MKFVLPGSETVTLTGQTIDKLVRAGDGDAALLYLYVLKTRGQSTSAEAASALGKSLGGIATAMAVLSRLGLVKLEETQDGTYDAQGGGSLAIDETREPSPSALPPGAENGGDPLERTMEEMKRELESGSVFFALVEDVQRSLGKIMSPDELLRLFGIYDALQLQPEVILQLITHCITESRARGSGRMPSMRYIEKAAFTWEREGIFSLNRAEEYIKALSERRSARGEIKTALQIKDREFSETEKRYVDGWIAMGFGRGAVEIAYDRTMVKTGKLAWGYMDSIMKNWHEKKLHTPQEIMEKDSRQGKKGKPGNAGEPTQKFGSADQDDINRMQRLLKRIKEEQ